VRRFIHLPGWAARCVEESATAVHYNRWSCSSSCGGAGDALGILCRAAFPCNSCFRSPNTSLCHRHFLEAAAQPQLPADRNIKMHIEKSKKNAQKEKKAKNNILLTRLSIRRRRYKGDILTSWGARFKLHIATPRYHLQQRAPTLQ